MRCDRDQWVFPERVVFGQGFGSEDIQCGVCDIGIKRGDERCVIYQRAATWVDDEGTVCKQRKGLFIQNVRCVVRKWQE